MGFRFLCLVATILCIVKPCFCPSLLRSTCQDLHQLISKLGQIKLTSECDCNKRNSVHLLFIVVFTIIQNTLTTAHFIIIYLIRCMYITLITLGYYEMFGNYVCPSICVCVCSVRWISLMCVCSKMTVVLTKGSQKPFI